MLALVAALAAPSAPDASQLSRTQQRAFLKCAELPDAESDPCMLNLLQLADMKGDNKKLKGWDLHSDQGTLQPESTLEHKTQTLATKTGAHAQQKNVKYARGSQEHGPKWEARYGGSDEQGESTQAAVKRLSKKQDPDTGGEAAAAARAEASGAIDDGKKVDNTDYQESDASSNPEQPLPAPVVCTGPGAIAGDPACESAPPPVAKTDAAADATPPGEGCIASMAGVSDEWCVTNCAIDNCPATMCDCSGGKEEEVDPNKPVCLSIAPNVSDDWCQTNCESWVLHEEGFFNCPPSQCKCTEHQSDDGASATHDNIQRMGYMKAATTDTDATVAAPQ